jgi:hypothetical protein
MDHFLLYDVFTPDGVVNEDILSYSNGSGSERALIVYHNKYAETRGWIKSSVGYMDKSSGLMRQSSLAEGLGLRAGERDFVIFRDVNGGLEYIRPSRGLLENGLYVELGAYKCHAFVDFREVTDVDGKWQAVSQALNGAGYWSMQARWDEMFAPKPLEAALPEKPKRVRKPAKKKPTAEAGTPVKAVKTTAKKPLKTKTPKPEQE